MAWRIDGGDVVGVDWPGVRHRAPTHPNVSSVEECLLPGENRPLRASEHFRQLRLRDRDDAGLTVQISVEGFVEDIDEQEFCTVTKLLILQHLPAHVQNREREIV